jgi:hypothetical protein
MRIRIPNTEKKNLKILAGYGFISIPNSFEMLEPNLVGLEFRDLGATVCSLKNSEKETNLWLHFIEVESKYYNQTASPSKV